MAPKKRIFISFLILIILVVAFYFITDQVSKYSGYSVSEPYTDFEKCLMKQQLTLYINTSDTDSFIKNSGMVSYIQFFKIKNCLSNNKPCLDNNIEKFPTWIINENIVDGEISLHQLSLATSCREE
jgi:hypothetical protein